jgi:hypothetical protein
LPFPGTSSFAQPRKQKPPKLEDVIQTSAGERIVARPTKITNGKLVLATEPAREIPLDELLSVEFAVKAALAPIPLGAAALGRDRKSLLLTQAELLALDEDSATLRTISKFELRLPLKDLRAVWFGTITDKEAYKLFEEQFTKPGTEDIVIVKGRDDSFSALAGTSRGLVDGKLRFRYEGEDRSIAKERVAGVVLAAAGQTPQRSDAYQLFRLANGDVFPGMWTALDSESIECSLASADKVRLPRAKVTKIEFRNGKVTYLSDWEPAGVEETPYFGRRMPYRRDESLVGQPLSMKGKPVAKGLAVHSRSVLTYALDGSHAAFRAAVGFDDHSGNRGRVACRVLGDGRELFAEKDLRADAEPKSIDVPISGVKQLTLEVDFGADEDIGDRVIWADARVVRGK